MPPRRVLLMGLVGLAACQAPPPSQPVPALAREGYVTTGDSVRLFYQVSGSGADTIVALHGGPGFSLAYLLPNLDALARSHTVIAYDQRGAGRSTLVTDSTRLRLADHVRDLDAVRRQLGIGRVTLLGHSWGSGLAAQYALAHPDRVSHLVLVASLPPRATPYMQEFSRNLRAWMDSATVARVAALSAARRDAADPIAACRAFWGVFIRGYLADPSDSTFLSRMRGGVCEDSPEAIRNGSRVFSSTIGALGDWDWRNDFRQIEAPVLVIHGDKDPIPLASALEWRDAFPVATLVTLTDAGHFPYVDHPEAVADAVNTFLQ